MEASGVDGTVILKWILTVWAGLIWLSLWASGELL